MDNIRSLSDQTTSTYLETMMDKLDKLPFIGRKPIVSPLLVFEGWQIFTSIGGETKIIDGLHTTSEVGMDNLHYILTFWMANVDSKQLLMLPHRVRTHRRNCIGLS